MLKKIFLIIIVAPILLFGGLFFYATRERRASSKAVLKNYQPSEEISEIAQAVAFTNEGKANFYRTNPEFVEGETFRKHCLKNKGIELALGCLVGYTPGKNPFSPPKMFLLKIDNPEYEDHKYPASVHETMHMVYKRLSSNEKENINSLLEKEFMGRQDDDHLIANINTLKDVGGDYVDELHSVFAVEYSDISPELEEYYSQYFENRQTVVGLYQSGGLEKRVRKVEQLNAEAAALNTKLLDLQALLQGYQNSGNTSAYNKLVPQFNSMVNSYNAKAAEVTKLYNEVSEFYKYFNPNYQPPKSK